MTDRVIRSTPMDIGRRQSDTTASAFVEYRNRMSYPGVEIAGLMTWVSVEVHPLEYVSCDERVPGVLGSA